MSSEALLPLLILIPFVGGLLAWLSEKQSTALPRWIALITMTVVFGLSLYLWLGHDFTLG
jgi:NADH-quinone oxidoreductase subunit M